jgi:hypothetical protein
MLTPEAVLQSKETLSIPASPCEKRCLLLGMLAVGSGQS